MNDRLRARFETGRRQILSEISDLCISVEFLHELPEIVVANAVKEIVLTRMMQEHPDLADKSVSYQKLAILHEKTKDQLGFLSYIIRLKKSSAGIYQELMDLNREIVKSSDERDNSLRDLYRKIDNGFPYNRPKSC